MNYSDAYVSAMWLMFQRAPRAERPDVDGHYSLGEVGEVREKTWSRLTPYSVAQTQPEEDEDICRCGQPDCVGHEVINNFVLEEGFTSRAVMNKSPHPIWQFDVPIAEAIETDLSPEEMASRPVLFLARWRPLE